MDATSTDATSTDATSTDATSTDATSTDATSSGATSTDATSSDGAVDDGETWGLFEDLDPVRDAILIKWLAEADARDRDRARQKRLRELGAPVAKRRTRPLELGDQRGSSPPIAVRFPSWLDEQLRRAFQARGVTPSEGVRQILEEWLVPQRFPALEYRGTEFQRLPAIRGGPTIVDWLLTEPPAPLPDDVHEQVSDYVALTRARFEAALRRPDVPPQSSRR